MECFSGQTYGGASGGLRTHDLGENDTVVLSSSEGPLPTHIDRSSTHMPRNIDDDIEKSAKRLVDTMVKYSLVAEDCLEHLRTFNETTVKDLWAKGDKIFMCDSVRYPSAIPPRNDPVVKEQFRSKCMTSCFPLSSNPPVGPKE